MKNAILFKRVIGSIHPSLKLIFRRSSAWTESGVIRSPYDNIEIPKLTVNDYVWQNLEKWPEKTITVCSETGRGYTYEQAFNLSNTFAANLRLKLKINDGDTISVMLPNLPDFPLIVTGIMGAGAVVSTINPTYTAHEVSRQLGMNEAKAIVTSLGGVKTVQDALNLAKLNMPIIVVKTNGDNIPENTLCYNELSEDTHVDKSCLKKVRRTPDDICFLPYSSGTTGLPKGVQLTHKNVLSNLLQMNIEAVKHHQDTTASHQNVVMGLLPFFHIYGATVLMFHKMSVGAKVVTLPKFEPNKFLESFQKFKIDTVFAAPPLILFMGLQGKPETYQNVRTLINGAAPLATTDVEKVLRKINKKMDFRQAYGLTETSPVVLIPPIGIDNHQTVGFPVSNTEVRVVNENLQNLGPNESGELLVKGPQVMKGYRDNPKANAEAFQDEWFRTGDLVFADNEGKITITDRLKELIKVKGFQVPPAELEAILRDHPSVSDAAVVGIPHPIKGEAPKAFIVLKPGQNVDSRRICEFVNEKVAPFKKIEEIVFIESIPKTASGKILRKDLK